MTAADDLDTLRRLGRAMRAAQRAFFKDKTNIKVLKEAKRLEREFDRLVGPEVPFPFEEGGS